MIRICHVTSVHPAKDVRIFYKECRSLSKEYEVYLVAPNVADQVVDNVHIVGVQLPAGRFKRQMHLTIVLKKALSVDAAIYHFHDPELISIGLKIQKHGKKVIFDSHEDVPMQILTKPWLPNILKKPFSHIYARYERYNLSRYDALISVTPHIVERLKSFNSTVIMIANYPDVFHTTDKQQCTEVTEGKYVCFAGGVSPRYMHEYVIKGLERTTAKYILAGPVDDDNYLSKLKNLKGWNKVEYLGVLDWLKVSQIYEKSIAGIVLLDYSPNVGYHKGTLGVLKMFEYMMAGIPVIATDFDIWKEIVEGNNCGVCIDPHNVEAIAEAINYYLEHPDKAKEQGQNGKKAIIEKYNWDTQEKELLRLYKTIN